MLLFVLDVGIDLHVYDTAANLTDSKKKLDGFTLKFHICFLMGKKIFFVQREQQISQNALLRELVHLRTHIWLAASDNGY